MLNKKNRLRKFIRRLFEAKIDVNYVFFGLFCLAFLIINLFHITIIESSSYLAKSFFILHSLGQTVVELSLLILVASFIKKKRILKIYYGFIAIVTFCFFVMIAELITVRIMDVSILEIFNLFFGASLSNFIEVIHLSEIGLYQLSVSFVLAGLISLVSVAFYILSDKWFKKTSFRIKKGYLIKSVFIVPLFLLAIDFFVSYQLRSSEYNAHKKMLPWKMTFLKENRKAQLETNPFHFHEDLAGLYEAIEDVNVISQDKPNIYLFVAESLREEFLTEKTASNLLQFKEDALAVQNSFSNSNASHLSWFSIFYSHYPFLWSYMANKTFSKGSPPLKLLKKMGYDINVLTAAELRYFGLRDVLFGTNSYLANSYEHYPHKGEITPANSDQDVMKSLTSKLKERKYKKGQVFIVFLDSTHFTYSWPKDLKVPFDCPDKLTIATYLSSSPKALDGIKNRYKNSIFFIDSLFGDFVSTLKSEKIYDESIVVFTGDHGEEFKEQGKLFHASNLSEMQTKVPLYLKLGLRKSKTTIGVASHIDIFPTLIHYLTSSSDFNKYFEGDSLLLTPQKRYAISARYNTCKRPNYFVADNGKVRLYMKFSEGLSSRKRRIKFLTMYQNGKEIKVSTKEAKRDFPSLFSSLKD